MLLPLSPPENKILPIGASISPVTFDLVRGKFRYATQGGCSFVSYLGKVCGVEYVPLLNNIGSGNLPFVRYIKATFSAFTSCNNNYPIGSPATINRSRSGIF